MPDDGFKEEERVHGDMGRWRADPVRKAIVLHGGAEMPLQSEILGPDRLRLLDIIGQSIESDLQYELHSISRIEMVEVAIGVVPSQPTDHEKHELWISLLFLPLRAVFDAESAASSTERLPPSREVGVAGGESRHRHVPDSSADCSQSEHRKRGPEPYHGLFGAKKGPLRFYPAAKSRRYSAKSITWLGPTRVVVSGMQFGIVELRQPGTARCQRLPVVDVQFQMGKGRGWERIQRLTGEQNGQIHESGVMADQHHMGHAVRSVPKQLHQDICAGFVGLRSGQAPFIRELPGPGQRLTGQVRAQCRAE